MASTDRIQEFCLRLLMGASPSVQPLSYREAEQAVAFFKCNKISPLELSQRGNVRFAADGVFEEVLGEAAEAELRKHKNWRESFIKVKEEWDRLGIAYLFLKSAGEFPHLSDNLDVLVPTPSFERAAAILRTLGYTELRNIQEAHKRFYRKFMGDQEWVPVHLHERVCWGFPFEDNEHLWSHALASKEDVLVHYPCPEDVVLIHTAHSFLEDHEIKVFDIWTIRKCLQKGALDWRYVIRTASEMHWLHALFTGFLIFEDLHLRLFGKLLFPPEIIEEAKYYIYERRWIRTFLKRSLSAGHLIMPFKIPHLWTRVHSSLRVLNDHSLGNRQQRVSLILRHLLDGFIHRKLRIKNHPRMFVAFCGLDGSGKTKHSRALQGAFRTCEINAGYIWSRAGSLPIIGFLLRVLRAAKSDYRRRVGRYGGEGKTSRSHGSSLSFAFWSTANSLDLAIFYFFRVTIPLLFGRVVIADRFIHDSLIDLEYIRGTSNFRRPLYRLLKRLTPTPDLLFFLDIQPDRILQRGVAEERTSLQKKYRLYQEVMKQSRAVVVDNSRPFREVGGEVIKDSLEIFFRKYPEKYVGYRLVSLRY